MKNLYLRKYGCLVMAALSLGHGAVCNAQHYTNFYAWLNGSCARPFNESTNRGEADFWYDLNAYNPAGNTPVRCNFCRLIFPPLSREFTAPPRLRKPRRAFLNLLQA